MKTDHNVLVSILNWNTSEMTGECVESVMKMRVDPGVSLTILVIDNGSAAPDWENLQRRLARLNVELIRNDTNRGFAGGHNVAIKLAHERQMDFIWLVNSDSLLEANTLTEVLKVMAADPQCGAVSPVVRILENQEEIDFCGTYHDWENLTFVRAKTVAEGRQMESDRPMDMWLTGTVVLFRMAALRDIGELNAHLFAYYEDDDIGIRLARKGWRNRMAFETSALHATPPAKQRPPHYFYLMHRNAFLFFVAHTPAAYRARLRWRLMDKAMFTANRLRRKGLASSADACLLGALDGWRGQGGVPALDRRPPLLMQVARKLLLLKHARWLDKVA
ncbi:glycosyltransferase [Massilia sp. S19_KUP03_FR1]|uniref:glycosyltransferase n=1 Tax=Massilia sp. S19_KUP03_FR1 TaxID=3025503 RepID=UPI002FCDB249